MKSSISRTFGRGLLGAVLAITTTVAGCGKKADKPTEGSAAPAGSSAPTTGSSAPTAGAAVATGSAAGSDSPAAGSAAVAAEADVPLEADFEEEATAKVTAANLAAELAALEVELGK